MRGKGKSRKSQKIRDCYANPYLGRLHSGFFRLGKVRGAILMFQILLTFLRMLCSVALHSFNYLIYNSGQTCGLYHKNILTIASDDHKWSLYYKCFIFQALAHVISYDHKWGHNLELHLDTTLEVSFTIVMCL